MFRFLAAALLLSLSALGETRVAVLVGPSNHPPGTHEVAAGGRLLAWALENMSNVPDVKANVYYEWPGENVLAEAAALVFIGDVFPLQRWPGREENLAALGRLAAKGKGIVCLHYATGLQKNDVGPNGEHPLLGWLGGYFATGGTTHHRGVARVMQNVTIEPNGEHEVARGWKPFTVDDEPYYGNYFGPEGNRPANGVTIFATSMLPPETPQREAVAWGIERADGGRGFGFVMPHFYANWAQDDMRRFILNGVVWVAKREVPAGGVVTPKPDLAAFAPASVEPAPKN
jgi:type 1 glutamine amidotransferase